MSMGSTHGGDGYLYKLVNPTAESKPPAAALVNVPPLYPDDLSLNICWPGIFGKGYWFYTGYC